MITALIIFILMYAGMLVFSKWRVWFALGAALAMVVMGIVRVTELPTAINWNVIMMITGTMGIVALFIETGMPARLADILISQTKNACWTIIMLAVFAGIISAFVDNVATVLMVAPVGLAICKKIKINPVPVIISIAVSSNLQGAATLVGDTTSILLGNYAGMSFFDFIYWQGKPSVFWAVELGALGTVLILHAIFKKYKQPIEVHQFTPVTDYFPGIMLLLSIVSLIIASFYEIPFVDDLKNGLICMFFLIICVARNCIKNNSIKPLLTVVKNMDYQTIGMLCGLFIVIEGITKAGIIDIVANFFASLGGDHLFLLYTIIVFASVVLSAFIDNIPYVAAMLPVVQGIAMRLGINPVVLYFGLLSGATLGGNITPFGASANVAGIGILKKEGYEVKNSDFAKIGIPFTLTAVTIGYLFIWFVWS